MFDLTSRLFSLKLWSTKCKRELPRHEPFHVIPMHIHLCNSRKLLQGTAYTRIRHESVEEMKIVSLFPFRSLRGLCFNWRPKARRKKIFQAKCTRWKNDRRQQVTQSGNNWMHQTQKFVLPSSTPSPLATHNFLSLDSCTNVTNLKSPSKGTKQSFSLARVREKPEVALILLVTCFKLPLQRIKSVLGPHECLLVAWEAKVTAVTSQSSEASRIDEMRPGVYQMARKRERGIEWRGEKNWSTERGQPVAQWISAHIIPIRVHMPGALWLN